MQQLQQQRKPFLLALVCCCITTHHLAWSDDNGDDRTTLPGASSNPFETGCLANALPGWTKQRVCNSEDPPNASDIGICRMPQLDYKEVRLYGYDWDSGLFSGWLMQIVLSELLDVPTSMETAGYNGHLNFYHPDSPQERISTYSSDVEALQTANKYGGDCTLASKEEENYEQCANFLSEVWDTTVSDILTVNVAEESPLGVVGQEAWFVPKFTAEQNPEILSYIGLQGLTRTNRRMLADLFQTPLTWGEYCIYISSNNCTTPDTVAQRPPQEFSSGNDSNNEVDRMFVDGIYTGYFTKLPSNDCDLQPDTCTGTFIDYPCGWGTYSDVQTHHLGIPLTPRRFGESSDYQVEIWKAANATKSDVMMMWWYPDALYNSFLGSDAEFIKVTLPTPTQECVESRIEWGAQCDEENFNVELTSPLGVCDYPPTQLTTYTSIGLQNDPSLADAMHSPAFDALTRFRISEHQIAEWAQIKSKSNSPREAICSWAVENIDFLQKLVPETYPRILTKDSISPIRYITISFAGLVLSCAIWMGVKVYIQRCEPIIKAAQIEFLYLLLLGSALMAASALVMGLPVSTIGCNIQNWLQNIGFTLQIVPLLVKVDAVNRLLTSGKKLRRISVTRKSLYHTVAFITAGMVVFLTLWTTYGGMKKAPIYTLSASPKTSEGDSIVIVEDLCRTDTPFWKFISLFWMSVLVLCGTVLAWQMRKAPSTFNEFQTLSRLIYSHFLFLILFGITLSLPVEHDSLWRQSRSWLVSLDTLVALGIYFIPKVFRGSDSSGSSAAGGSNRRRSRIGISSEFSMHSTENLTIASLKATIALQKEEITALKSGKIMTQQSLCSIVSISSSESSFAGDDDGAEEEEEKAALESLSASLEQLENGDNKDDDSESERTDSNSTGLGGAV